MINIQEFRKKPIIRVTAASWRKSHGYSQTKHSPAD